MGFPCSDHKGPCKNQMGIVLECQRQKLKHLALSTPEKPCSVEAGYLVSKLKNMLTIMPFGMRDRNDDALGKL